MGLFENTFVSKIKRDEKKHKHKSKAKTILFAVAMCANPFLKGSSGGSHTLDLSPFTVPAEQMYQLSTEMELC